MTATQSHHTDTPVTAKSPSPLGKAGNRADMAGYVAVKGRWVRALSQKAITVPAAPKPSPVKRHEVVGNNVAYKGGWLPIIERRPNTAVVAVRSAKNSTGWTTTVVAI